MDRGEGTLGFRFESYPFLLIFVAQMSLALDPDEEQIKREKKPEFVSRQIWKGPLSLWSMGAQPAQKSKIGLQHQEKALLSPNIGNNSKFNWNPKNKQTDSTAIKTFKCLRYQNMGQIKFSLWFFNFSVRTEPFLYYFMGTSFKISNMIWGTSVRNSLPSFHINSFHRLSTVCQVDWIPGRKN